MKKKAWTLANLILATLLAFGDLAIVSFMKGNITLAQQSSDSMVFLPNVINTKSASWPMVAGNPERTSWSSVEVTGKLQVEWYRPIEAYIPQNVQVIASNGLLYIATARGLYALNAANGEIAWRYDTEIPLGNSPTVASNVVYIGGYDHKIHALNALNGTHLWAFDEAKAGFSTNPLVVRNKVIAGNRDGAIYAIGAHGTTRQGRLVWKFQAGGPIHLSAAYKGNAIYFAAADNIAYALNVDTGTLLWKSAKLPGDGYHSYWPVIYQDKVIFSAAHPYRHNLNPGTRSVLKEDNTSYDAYGGIQKDDIFPEEPSDTLLGPTVPNQNWAHGFPVIDGSRLTEYLENNPNPDPHWHKPWRRLIIVLNQSDGREYTFDSDGDGYGEYLPAGFWGTKSGNRYPPIVGPDNILYFNNIYKSTPYGIVTGWKIGTQYLSIIGGAGAVDEPQAISGGGNVIYRSICCDRVGDWFSIITRNKSENLWHYSSTLKNLAPGYDEMWTILPGLPRLTGWYKGNSDSINGIYHNHGDQNPIVPYEGRLYVHRSNAIIAFGNGAARGRLPLLTIRPTQDTSIPTPGHDEITSRLEEEIQKILDAGHLKPGYYNNGQFNIYKELADYFDNPGDTLYVLAQAYPHLSPQIQTQLRTYLRNEFHAYFDPTMYSTTGWAEGISRDSVLLPPEVEAALPEFQKKESAGARWSWSYPQHNFYAMWKYAQVFPEDAVRVYELAKTKLQVPVPKNAEADDNFAKKPYELNGYIAGYIGFLKLQELAKKSGEDSQLRAIVINERDRLMNLRVRTFTKDTYGLEESYHKRLLNIARNFIYMVPELGDYLSQYAMNKVREAVDEYEYIAPYWFVSRYESVIDEGVMSNLYNYNAIFLAKAYILNEPYEELTKYLDAPAFIRGDLFYILNLITALEAQT